MRRRTFIKTGLIFVPTLALAQPSRFPAFRAGAFASAAGGGGGSCDTQKDSQTGTTNNFADNSSYNWAGYNFTAGSSYTLCKLRLRLAKVGSPAGNVVAAIYSNNVDVPGSQVGTASDAVTATALPTSEGDVDLSNLSASLNSGTVYWVVVKTTTGNGTDNVRFVHYRFDGVPSHRVVLSDNSGSSWDGWTDNNQGKFISYSA